VQIKNTSLRIHFDHSSLRLLAVESAVILRLIDSIAPNPQIDCPGNRAV
jgi:hypothetical protein